MVKKRKKITEISLIRKGPEKLKPETDKIKKTKVRMVGIGGGGGSIVSEIASKVKKASFVVANTDSQALKVASKKAIRFQFGQTFTKGLGTGMNPQFGELAAQNEKEKIKKIFQGQDLAILVACLGGGVGSGAAPIFAKIAKKSGLITFGIFTLPFKFEGEKKMEIAKESLRKLKPHLNAFSIIPNERIFQIIDKNTTLKEALSAINKNLAESLEGLIETIYQPGLINIDFADLKTILEGRGKLAYLNTIEVSETNGELEALKKVLSSPLYPYTIQGAKGLLFNIFGEKKLSLAEVSQISKSISEIVNKEAKIIFGIFPSQKYQDKIKVTLLATGCGTKIEGLEEKRVSLPQKLKKERLEKQPLLKPPQPESLAKKEEKPKEVKIKVQPFSKKTEKKEVQPAIETKTDLPHPPNPKKNELKVRKNALQIKKEAEEAERELIKKEQFWETPAFLRQKMKNKDQ